MLGNRLELDPRARYKNLIHSRSIYFKLFIFSSIGRGDTGLA